MSGDDTPPDLSDEEPVGPPTALLLEEIEQWLCVQQRIQDRPPCGGDMGRVLHGREKDRAPDEPKPELPQKPSTARELYSSRVAFPTLWGVKEVRTLLLGTHDPHSSLNRLRGQHALLEEIVRSLLPEIFVTTLIQEIIELNPGASEAWLWRLLTLNPDKTIHSWDLHCCKLTTLPERFGGVSTCGDLNLGDNLLSSLPDSFGSVTVGRHLLLSINQLTSLPDSFWSITVGGDLYLSINKLRATDIPAYFPNVGGTVSTEFQVL